MVKSANYRSNIERILLTLHKLKFVDLYRNLKNTEAIENSWEDVTDLYSENRRWDINSAAVISKTLGNLDGKVGLDIGCGGGQKTILLTKNSIRIIATDISSTAVKKTMQKGIKENVYIEGVQCLGEFLPFKNNTFDYIISNEVIEHVPNDKGLLAESARVIKPTGIITIGIPNIYDLRTFLLDFVYFVIKGLVFKVSIRKYVGPFRAHVHLYTRNSFYRLCLSSGLKINEIFDIYSPSSDTFLWIGGYFKRFPTRDINIFLVKIVNLLIFIYPKFSLYTYVFCLRK